MSRWTAFSRHCLWWAVVGSPEVRKGMMGFCTKLLADYETANADASRKLKKALDPPGAVKLRDDVVVYLWADQFSGMFRFQPLFISWDGIGNEVRSAGTG